MKESMDIFKLKHNMGKRTIENQLIPSLKLYLDEVNLLLKNENVPGSYQMESHSNRILNEIKDIIENDILTL
jgi:hypothetical protein